MRAEYRVLGPLEVLLDGGPVAVPAGRCQVLLAALLLRPNQFVSADELVDIIWDGAPSRPDRARSTLQMVVGRLRTALGDANCVRTVTRGYRAEVDPDQLDLLRFRALVGSSDFGAASALWRGPVLANVTSESLHRDHVPALVSERLAVLERRIDADLDRGLAGELVTELRSLVADHPLRESFWRHLMLALYRSGQQAEALTTYQTIRERLADELGADPSRELQDLHEQILRDDVAVVSRRQVPHQLPPGVRNFVGRYEELAALDKADGITVVHGVGGVGKTTLALHWARAVRDDYPDGDLYVNLRGFDPDAQPVDPASAAETLLVGLGVKEVPAQDEARFALLRTELADCRLLLVLDNAASPRQVFPLLPGSTQVRVVVTSRNQLRALVAQHDATAIGLRQLDLDAAHTLLSAVLGAERLAVEPVAAREIVDHCAGLPLALRVFAERVARFPDTPLREFVAELDEARLDALTDFDDLDIRAVFSWSYRALDADSARMFRLLSVHPGFDFDVSAAAAIADVSVAQARRLLERLVADHLVQSKSPGRYDLHDLLRAYAAELCGDDSSAALRMTEFYVHTLSGVMPQLAPTQKMSLGAPPSGVAIREFSSRFDALTWCREEWDNLRAVMYAAIPRGWDHLARLIPAVLHPYLNVDGSRKREAVDMYEAVQTFGTEREQGFLLMRLASIYGDIKRETDALRCYESAMKSVRAAGEKTAEAAGLINMADLYTTLGRPQEALDVSRQAVAVALELGNAYYESASRGNVVWSLNRLGRYLEALAEGEIVNAVVTSLGDEYLTAQIRFAIASALTGVGRCSEALPLVEASLEVMRRFGDQENEALGLEELGKALSGLDRRSEAVAAWKRSLTLWREHDADLHAAAVEALLAEAHG